MTKPTSQELGGTWQEHLLGAAIDVSIPTATGKMFAGAAGLGVAARALVGMQFGRVRLASNVGIRARQRGRLGDVVQGNDALYSAALSYEVVDDLSTVVEVFGTLGLSGAETEGTSPLEAVAAIRWGVTDRMSVAVGGGRGLVDGVGAPSVRGFVGAMFTTSRRGEESLVGVSRPAALDPGGDEDGDGIKNGVDRCARQAEDKDGFEDADGCPDPDNDGDKIADVADKCPQEAEDLDGFQDSDGCIDGDNDEDGILDVADKCPDEPEDVDGFQDDDGCDDVDNDQDGIPDVMDACPVEPETKNGVKDNDGCPEKKRRRRRRGRR